MQPDMIASALHALELLLEPARMGILILGVVIGLAIGVLPGLNGIVGMAMLIPFTYNLAAVITSSDFITAVLFGVPGHVGAAATVIDGHAMARKGEAGRAFGAGFAASLAGGIVGAIVLAVSIPILRPVMLSNGTPDLLAFTLFGMSMVATLSGRAPLKGHTAAALGLMIAMVGSRAAFSRCRSSPSLRCRGSALPATMRPTSICPASGRACAMWRGTGGWYCAAACSAQDWAPFRASARR